MCSCIGSYNSTENESNVWKDLLEETFCQPKISHTDLTASPLRKQITWIYCRYVKSEPSKIYESASQRTEIPRKVAADLELLIVFVSEVDCCPYGDLDGQRRHRKMCKKRSIGDILRTGGEIDAVLGTRAERISSKSYLHSEFNFYHAQTISLPH